MFHFPTFFWGVIAQQKNKYTVPVGATQSGDNKRKVLYPGIKGIATIVSPPEIILEGLDKHYQELWVGTKIRGYIMSPAEFMAKDFDECFSSLKLFCECREDFEDLLHFWVIKKREFSFETLSFERCFIFEKKHWTSTIQIKPIIGGIITL